MKDLILFNEYFSVADCNIKINLNESVNSKLTTFRGKFQQSESINKNKRIYPHAVLDENVKTLMPTIKDRGLLGECDHANDSIVHLEKASHVITKLWWEGNNLMGEGEILSTPHGKILKALLSDGARVGISSRGIGNGRTDENGILVIGEGYKLITFDAVADPSTHKAFQEIVTKKESYIPTAEFVMQKNDTNKSKFSKETTVACFGGIIESLKKDLFKNIK